MFRLFCCTPIIPLHIEIQLSKLFMRPYRILLQITPIKVSQSSEWAAPRSEGLPKVGEQEASLPDLPTRPSHVSLAFALSMIMHFFVPVCSGYWILIVLTDWIRLFHNLILYFTSLHTRLRFAKLHIPWEHLETCTHSTSLVSQ